jgi:KUP system potassium uptake protein
MLIWHLGANAVSARLQDAVVPVDAFMAKIVEGSIPRVPGTAVFLTRTQRDVPPVMAWHVKHNRALHEKLFVLTVTTESVPWVRDTERLSFEEIAPQLLARSRPLRFYGAARRSGAAPGGAQAWMRHRSRRRYLHLADVTYYVGHETVVPADDEKALPRWVEALVAFMQRNSALDRLFQAADRCGRRNRPGNIDLSRDQSR